MRAIAAQDGSALVEAAILFPCLLLVLFWSMALTEVLVLKLKASEAARFALWETTVWKSPARIQRQVQQRFADLVWMPSKLTKPSSAMWCKPGWGRTLRAKQRSRGAAIRGWRQ